MAYAPNQKLAIICKEPANADNPYTVMNLEALKNAARRMNGRYSNGFVLWSFLASNQPGFTVALSNATAKKDLGMSKDAYDTAVGLLIRHGFLQREHGQTYKFYEYPGQHKEGGKSGLSPQSKSGLSPQDNIIDNNTIMNISNLGGGSSVSPSINTMQGDEQTDVNSEIKRACHNELPSLSDDNIRVLQEWCNTLPSEVVLVAICMTKEMEPASEWAYIKKVLDSYKAANHKSADDVFNAEYKRGNSQQAMSARRLYIQEYKPRWRCGTYL